MLKHSKAVLSTLCFIIVLSVHHLGAQPSLEEVMTDKNYVCKIGEGETLEQADKAALKLLATHSAEILVNDFNHIKEVFTEKGVKYEEISQDDLAVISNVYLENVGRIVMSDVEGACKVVRYMTQEDFAHRFDKCIEQIKNYVRTAQDNLADKKIEAAIRNFAWAFALTKSCPVDIKMPGIESGVPQYCIEQINNILSKVDVKVIGIEKDTDQQTYPYRVFADVTWAGSPVESLTYHYFDGSGFVNDQKVKDGRVVLEMQSLVDPLDFQVECVYMNLARMLDQRVSAILESHESLRSFEGAFKKVKTKPKGVKATTKTFDNTSSKVKSVVDDQLEAAHNNQFMFTIDTNVPKEEQYLEMMKNVETALRKGNLASIKDYFSPVAWKEFNDIVASGNPRIVRTPEYKMIKLDTLVMCKSIPLKLRFKGGNSFVEDVCFRISANSDKIVNVAYTLSARTQEMIMSMQWEDRARILLINFLEDYRTAYCLKDINYIEKIFANDAYIVTGKILRPRPSKKGDRADVVMAKETVVYQRKSKGEYIHSLRESFRGKEFVNIQFDECNAAKGFKEKEGMYAVQMRQHYYSDNYADQGWLTLAIDMRQDKDPLIKVRVWQQEKNDDYSAETMIEETISVATGI